MDIYLCYIFLYMYLLYFREGCVIKEYKLLKMLIINEKLLFIYYNSF